MKNTERDPIKLTPRGRKAVALAGAILLGAAGLGVAHGAENGDATKEYGYIMIDNGDNGTSIGRELGNGNENIREIAQKIQDQAGDDGMLQPGQVVRVNKEYVDHPEFLLQDYDPSANEH